MLSFSQRKGFKPVSTVLQTESMSDELRNSLWNIIYRAFTAPRFATGIVAKTRPSLILSFIKELYLVFLKWPIDTISSSEAAGLQKIRNLYFDFDWFEVYDFLEFFLRMDEWHHLADEINYVLERELSGYRYIGDVITNITDKQEVELLKKVLDDKDFPHVNTHLKTALELLSDRDHPDYRNSIKESISAVESIASQIAGKRRATLPEALKEFEKKGLEIHPALKDGFSKIYGYTSDANGIRHALMDEPNLTAADAKFFLLSCTSFINYLKAKI